jgi:AcrR family transcriptional regulator
MSRTRSPDKAGPPARQNLRKVRRQNTEQRIVDAFGRIVARDGLYQVRVNKLMREAGVGKKQLYQYFGDLSGVARAWTAAGMPAPAAPLPVTTRHTRPGSRVTRLTLLLRDYADAARTNPAVFTSLHAELGGPRELRQPFDEIRAQVLRKQVTFFLENPFMRSADYTALYSILYAAINYLALRARFAPAFNGLDLAKPAGWDAALDMVEAVAAMSEAGIRRRPAARKPASRPRGSKRA